MNKITLMGRLVRDPEIKYSRGEESIAVVKYTLAVPRRFKKNGEEVDFINCVAFGKTGEIATKYLSKGDMVGVSGRLQVSSWETEDGQKRWNTVVIVEEYSFAGSKSEKQKTKETETSRDSNQSWQAVDDEDNDLPF